MHRLNLSTRVGQFILRFVRESNEIEDLSIPDSALMATWQSGRGHMGAARDALKMAELREPLRLQQICTWQAAITREQLPYGHWIAEEHVGCLRRQHMGLRPRRFGAPETIEASLNAILDDVNATVAGSNGPDALALAAEMHWRFELVHPFVDGNGRTGRLVVLYTLRGAGVRPVLFTAGDKHSRYYRAFDPGSPEAMMDYFREHQLEEDPWS